MVGPSGGGRAVIVKLGGSLITHKDRSNTIRTSELSDISREIADVWNPDRCKIICTAQDRSDTRWQLATVFTCHPGTQGLVLAQRGRGGPHRRCPRCKVSPMLSRVPLHMKDYRFESSLRT